MRILTAIMIFITLTVNAAAQSFDYQRLLEKTSTYTVAVNLVIEVSFGTQTTEAKNRGIGTIVTADGLVMFDGTAVDSDDPFSVMSGMQISAEPKEIEIEVFDGTKYKADYIGMDRYTKIGFCRIITTDDKKFDHIQFRSRDQFRIGEWLVLFHLLPKFVSPSLAVDIGLISAMVEEPEIFVLTMGFNELEMTSVLYDSTGEAVGVLGNLENPALSGFSPGQDWNSFSEMEDYFPLLGVIDADRLNRLIADPPKKGKPSRGWMGVYLQALTPDIAEFWGIDSRGGIIINEVVKNSPADLAGIKTGDVIIRLFDNPIEVDKEENLPVFQKQISELGTGATVRFSILRRSEEQNPDTLDISFELTQAPLTPAEAPEYEDENFELKIRDMVFADYNMYQLNQEKFKGVVVKEVESGGWADIAAIMPGDIIQKIDGEKIGSSAETEELLKKIGEKKPREVIFFIWRENKTMFINVKTVWKN